jgi:hypothetical protein
VERAVADLLILVLMALFAAATYAIVVIGERAV